MVPAAQAETRTLKLYYLHTKERATITFKKNGRYIPGGLKKLNRFLRDWRRNEPTRMDPRLFDLVWEVYKKSGSRDYIHVISGYRSPATNSMLRKRGRGVAKKSQHTLGKALDFYLPDVGLAKLRRLGLTLEQGGVGYYPRSGSPFVHLDVGSVRHWPRMSRKQLMAMFPDGRTLHVPRDGKPLPGYKVALARYEKRKKQGGTIALASVSPSATLSSRQEDRGFLSTLFGGGRDEQEESARDFQAAPAKTKKNTEKPAETVPLPKKPEKQDVETLIAALPSREIPLPVAAPRPRKNVGGPEQGEQTVAALNPAEAGETGIAAIPLPTRRPGEAPETAAERREIPQDVIVALIRKAEGQVASDTRYVTALAREPRPSAALAVRMNGGQQDRQASPSDVGALRTGRVPVPQPADREMRQLALASVAAPRLPELEPAPTERAGAAGKTGRLAAPVIPASLRGDMTASLTRAKPEPRTAGTAKIRFQQSAYLESAIKVAPKRAKPDMADIEPSARPHVVTISRDRAEWAFRASHVPEIRSVASLAQAAIRQQPTTVYKLGFGDAPDSGEAHRFTGSAVTFLSIARFSATN